MSHRVEFLLGVVPSVRYCSTSATVLGWAT